MDGTENANPPADRLLRHRWRRILESLFGAVPAREEHRQTDKDREKMKRRFQIGRSGEDGSRQLRPTGDEARTQARWSSERERESGTLRTRSFCRRGLRASPIAWPQTRRARHHASGAQPSTPIRHLIATTPAALARCSPSPNPVRPAICHQPSWLSATSSSIRDRRSAPSRYR